MGGDFRTQFPEDQGRGQERGVTTSHFTRLMGWESLAVGPVGRDLVCDSAEDLGAGWILSI